MANTQASLLGSVVVIVGTSMVVSWAILPLVASSKGVPVVIQFANRYIIPATNEPIVNNEVNVSVPVSLPVARFQYQAVDRLLLAVYSSIFAQPLGTSKVSLSASIKQAISISFSLTVVG